MDECKSESKYHRSDEEHARKHAHGDADEEYLRYKTIQSCTTIRSVSVHSTIMHVHACGCHIPHFGGVWIFRSTENVRPTLLEITNVRKEMLPSGDAVVEVEVSRGIVSHVTGCSDGGVWVVARREQSGRCRVL